jgi:D-aspartate ligase
VIDDEPSIAKYSRYVSRAVRVADLRDEEQTVSALLDVGRRLDLDGWVLYPTRDETVVACARHRDALAEQFRVSVPPWESTRWASDKRLTYRLAAEVGVPAPHSTGLADRTHAEGEFPLVIKPAFKSPFIYKTGVKAWRADTPEQLRKRTEDAAAHIPRDEIIVQDYVPGDGRHQFAFCALVREGEAVASMVVNRRRQHPPQFGRASTYVSTVHMPELERLSGLMLRAMEYEGLVEIEFKLDPRDGQPKLLDVNARSWGYHTLGRRAGVDFPLLQYALSVGDQVPSARATTGVAWIRLLTDVPTSAAEIVHGRLGVSAFLRSLRRSQAESVFSRRDPLPGLAELALVPHLVRSKGLSVGDAA